MRRSVPKSAGHFLPIDGFLSSIEMHGLSHEYLLQAISGTIQSSDSFSDGINIFAPKENVSEESIFSAPFLSCGPGSILHTLRQKHNMHMISDASLILMHIKTLLLEMCK